MLSEDFEVCGFGVESDFCVGPVAEGFVAGASASAQGSEDRFPWTCSTVCIIEMIQRILLEQRKERFWILSVWNKPEEKRARFGLLLVHYNWLVPCCCRSRIICSNCSLVISPLAYRSRMM